MYILHFKEEEFLAFETLKDFNRYSKKWLGHNFKNIINSDQSERLKVFNINYRLRYGSRLFRLIYEEEKLND